jgi:hypothetical protein
MLQASGFLGHAVPLEKMVQLFASADCIIVY